MDKIKCPNLKIIKDQQSKLLEAAEKNQMNSIDSEMQSDIIQEKLAEHAFLADIWLGIVISFPTK